MNESNQQNSALKIQKISFWDAVSILVGTGIGAGIMSLAYGAKDAGFPVLVFWIVVAGLFTTISMLYIAEVTLRTKTPHQLSGLAYKYVGPIGSWIMFAAVFVNSLGALTAYTTGSGDVLASLFGIPKIIGSLLFFIPAILVIWFGLKILGAAEKIITIAMLFMVLLLILATFFGPKIQMAYLSFFNISHAIPVFSLVIFTFIAQYTVPELARGLHHDAKKLPLAIIVGMGLTALLIILVPMAALGLTGPEHVTEVVTIAWADALGQWAFFIANIFTLCAFMTSFWAIGGTLLTNIIDKFKFPSEWDLKYRLISLSIVAIPPFIVAYTDVIGFVEVLSITGSFAGAVMGILPIMMLRKARKNSEREPEWSCGWIAHPLIQYTIIVLFVGAATYTMLDLLHILPSHW
ncbi:MAG TPA: aromatic amino acid transport family protein [Pseudogracilibacillus sp.]|nr:aromatic amino acid transport family protein [Pseudogracilibacillus sp.]